MMYIITALVLCSSIALGFGSVCPDEEWKQLENSCFYFSTEERTWNGARDFCRNMPGGDAFLVYIGTWAENSFIKDRLNTYQYEHFFHIGATDSQDEGTFSWVGLNTLIEYSNWTPGEPNNAGRREDCVEMNPATGKWNDIPCDESQRFVCRIDL